jgi:hypothetical protein
VSEDGIMDLQAALQVYKELADWYERQGQPAMRDRFLILSAEAAFSAGKPDEAERLRQRLLQGNPHHMLKPFSSFAQALQSTNIQIYIHDLQVNYPPESAEDLLHNLRGGGGQAAAEVPRTAPLIDIRDEPTLPLSGSMEALKVYPLREEPEPMPKAEPTLPPAPPIKPTRLDLSPPRQSPTVVPERPSKLEPPTQRPQPALPRSPVPTRSPRRVAPPPQTLVEPAAPAGAWLTLLLFGMTVTAGVALALYTLARPFLPPHWRP